MVVAAAVSAPAAAAVRTVSITDFTICVIYSGAISATIAPYVEQQGNDLPTTWERVRTCSIYALPLYVDTAFFKTVEPLACPGYKLVLLLLLCIYYCRPSPSLVSYSFMSLPNSLGGALPRIVTDLESVNFNFKLEDGRGSGQGGGSDLV